MPQFEQEQFERITERIRTAHNRPAVAKHLKEYQVVRCSQQDGVVLVLRFPFSTWSGLFAEGTVRWIRLGFNEVFNLPTDFRVPVTIIVKYD